VSGWGDAALKTGRFLKGDRASAFALAAVKRGLVSSRQARECVGVSRKLERRGKPVKIEQVFIRKGYLTRTEAKSLSRKVKAAPPKLQIPAAQPTKHGTTRLSLIEEERGRCTNCKKDPGDGDDCARCGADKATGGPGPNATACDACSRIVLVGTALCPRCAAPIGRGDWRRSRQAGLPPIVDKLVVLLALLGVFYFLVYRTVIAPRGDEPAVVEEETSPLVTAQVALEAGQPQVAVDTLERALEAARPGSAEADTLRRALVLASRARGDHELARQSASAYLAEHEDPALRVLVAGVAVDQGRLDEAEDQLARIEPGQRPRTYARVALRLALAYHRRGLRELAQEQHPQAVVSFRAGLVHAPDQALLHLGLGLSLERLGEPDEAALELREFVRLAEAQDAYAERVEQAKARISTLEGD
jgi:Tetratricopeptide repeat